jgi:hypothetical protein
MKNEAVKANMAAVKASIAKESNANSDGNNNEDLKTKHSKTPNSRGDGKELEEVHETLNCIL